MGRSRTSKSGSTPSNGIKKVKGENFYRDAKAASRVKMLVGGKAIRDKQGRVVEAAAFQKGEEDTKPGRVMPDRRWFGNTRVISQTALDHFRQSLSARQDDPYTVLLRRNKLPMSLLNDASSGQKRSHIIETEPFQDTFGPKSQRKKPKVDFGSFEALSLNAGGAIAPAQNKSQPYPQPMAIEGPSEGGMIRKDDNGVQLTRYTSVAEPVYAKGTSRRIYGELYKVLDSSDVIVHVLDARDPLGTLCRSVLDWVRKEKPHKQVVYLINKIDLVPSWVTSRYVAYLTPQAPTLAFHASQTHSFGKGSLIQLLRQFSQLHSERKQISVGFVGYPNVGKSSVINCLKAGKVCKTAPIPGETKVWQYITLMRRIYLIDCPGIVPASVHDSPTSKVLKGVVRVENLLTPSEHIPALLLRVRPAYLERTYELGPGLAPAELDSQAPGGQLSGPVWTSDNFLDTLARKSGRLLKGGEPDRETVAKMVLNDWIRGRIPFFVPPPDVTTRSQPETSGQGVSFSTECFSTEGVMDSSEEWTGVALDGAQGTSPDTPQSTDASQLPKVFQCQGALGDGSPTAGVQWEDLVGASSGTLSKDEDAGASHQVSWVKEPRMTTSKRKATNFFTTANVKNKRRDTRRTVRTG